jgi:hypothetical protein
MTQVASPLDTLDLDALAGPAKLQGAPGGSVPNQQGSTAKTEEPPTIEAKEKEATPDFKASLLAKLKEQGLELNETDDVDAIVSKVAARPKAAPVHPEAALIQAALDSGKTLDQYYQERTEPDRLIKLDDESLVIEALTRKYGRTDARPDGWDAEKVKAVVEGKKADLPLMAEDIRDGLREQKKKHEEALKAYVPEEQEPAYNPNDPKVVEKFKEAVKTSVTDLAKEGTLYGMPLGSEMTAEKIAARVEALLTPDPKTGISITEARLQKNDGYVRMALMLELAEQGHFGKVLKDQKDGVTRMFAELLDKTPPTDSAGGAKEGGIDLNRLGAPATLK